jgi:uncharacterized protein DUF5924/DUF2914 family protein
MISEPQPAPETTPALEPAEPAPPPATPPSGFRARFRRILPWVSLCIGVISALIMDRGPRRAAFVAFGSVVVWAALIALHWMARLDPAHGGWLRRTLLGTVRRSSLIATQSLVQLTLFFALPFYFKAASFNVGHVAFLSALSIVSAISLWDPLTEWLFTGPLRAPMLPAIGSFVALDAVLPGLGLSTRVSLWIAAFTSALGVVALAAFHAPPERRVHVAGLATLGTLLLPFALQFGAASVVPAAPLRLTKIEIGTGVLDHEAVNTADRYDPAPPRLYCVTAIWSPIGVKDRLFHVWRYDGAERMRIELDIRGGGRGGGFRTFSRVQLGSAHPAGKYRCSVETEAGQVLGEKTVRVGG